MDVKKTYRHEPISSENVDLKWALYGSFLPFPSDDLFPAVAEELAPDQVPGALAVLSTPIIINEGRRRVQLRVTNMGDRPIQVGSRKSPTSPLLSKVASRLPFLRNEQIPGLRPVTGPLQATGHCSRYCSPLRTRRFQDCDPGRHCRQPQDPRRKQSGL
jgi:hypothetical protein